MHNIYGVKRDSESTALDRMRGKTGTVKPKTLPYGVQCYGKPTEPLREDERLCTIAYLGPVSTTGGGVFGVLVGDSRIGVEDPDKVRTFQACRVESPCVWPGELNGLNEAGSPHLDTDPMDVNPNPVDEPGAAEGPPEKQKPAVLGLPTPTKAWVKQEGPTKGCYACEGFKKSGTLHGRTHSRACKERYKKWLEAQAPKDEPERPLPAAGAPPAGRPRYPNPIGIFDDPEEPSGSSGSRQDPGAPVE